MVAFSVFAFESMSEAATSLEWLLWFSIFGIGCLVLSLVVKGAGEAATTPEW